MSFTLNITNFQLQMLALDIQSSLMKQVAEIVAPKLGYCPPFFFSQEPLDHDTKLKVTISFTMEPPKDTVGLVTKPDDKKMHGIVTSNHLLDSDITSISAESPTLLGSRSHVENLFALAGLT